MNHMAQIDLQSHGRRIGGTTLTNLVLTGVCALLAIGCASGPPRSLTSQLASTDTSIQQAEQTGAAQGGLAELQQAKDKRAKAQVALDDRKYELSMQLAQQAQVDAQYANTKARTKENMRNAADAAHSNETLRQETQRATDETAKRE